MRTSKGQVSSKAVSGPSLRGAWRKCDAVVQVYQIHDLNRALWGCVWTPTMANGRWEAKIAPSPRARKQRFLGAFETEQEAKAAVERAVERRAGR